MAKKEKISGTNQVNQFLQNNEHTLKEGIHLIRKIILESNNNLTEHIKWNAPSFCFKDEDKITFKLNSKDNIQIIFHRGAKVKEVPKDKFINESTGILKWATNDRAVATFVSLEQINENKDSLIKIINEWIEASKNDTIN